MAEQEDFAKLPLTDQFTHKNWKARKGGYETATKDFKTCQPNDPIIREFTDAQLWKGAVADSNVAAQQEALNAYNAFLDAAGTDGARRTRASTVQPIVEKGLTGRPAAKAAALESLLLLIELDKPDPVVEELLPLLSHKLPKVIVPTLAALKEIYHAYGCKTVEPKPVLKLLPKAYGHADKNVRAEAQALTVELYRWLREAMKPLFWGELKEVQQKDLDKLFEPVKEEPQPKQERLLRSQQAAKEEAEAAGGDEEEAPEGEEEAGIDLEPEFEAVDVFAKVPKDFGERLASSKWKDRKEALDDVFAAVNVPAIQDGPFDEIIRGCAKSMKDANIMVVTVAANCVEAIAKGLKRPFSKYRSTILAPMLERFKEKKPSVTDAIGAACDAVFATSSLGEVQTDILEALKSKNPQVKENSAKLLTRCLKTTREAPSPEQTKELAEAGKKLLTESVASLRDVGAEILGVLWKIMGDRNMLSHLDGLDDIRKTKIKEFSDAAEVRAKWKPKAAPPPAAKAAPAGKKAPPGRRPAPGATKKPAAKPPPPPQSPPPAEDPPALAPRATTRPAAKGPGGLRPPGAGLRAPGSGLQKPGAGLKPPSGAASPKRQGVVLDDPPPSTTPAPKSAPNRGLAGRPLGKPAAAAATPASPPRNAGQEASPLTSVERQELADLRAELEGSRQTNADLRADKARLSSQIAELQNANAQLIEDHTRDVLQIKAKETQLVRARSDAETAEDRAGSVGREVERLKREISRLSRAGGRESPADFGMGGVGGGRGVGRSMSGASSQQGGYEAPFSPIYAGYGGGGVEVANGGEGKENIPQPLDSSSGSGGGEFRSPAKARRLKGDVDTSMPPPGNRPMSNGSSGHATPVGASFGEEGSLSGRSSGFGGGPGGGDGRQQVGRTQSEGVESWKRAAEVTQNLKARIEMMKARQNIGRG